MMYKAQEKSVADFCIINNIHGLFIYYLIDPERFLKSTFVISDGISPEVRKKIPSAIYYPSFNNHSRYVSLLLRAIYYHLKKMVLFIQKKEIIAYGHDHLYFSQLYIKKAKNFTLIEDGLANYKRPKKNNGSLLRRIVFGSDEPLFGWSEKINKIILSAIVDVPKELINKTFLIDINDRWNNLTPVQKDTFMNLFSSESYQPLSRIVIFTQPFSEDGMMTELEKINIYKRLYEHYSKKYHNNDICIKSHPREITDYSKYFDCLFVKTKLPGQIMIAIDQPDIIATIYSSVGFVKSHSQTHIWGTSFNKTLLEKVGYYAGNYDGV